MYFIIGGILALIVFSIGILSITNDKVMNFVSNGELKQSLIKEFYDDVNVYLIILIYIFLLLAISTLFYVGYPVIILLILYFRYLHSRINNRKQF